MRDRADHAAADARFSTLRVEPEWTPVCRTDACNAVLVAEKASRPTSDRRPYPLRGPL